MLQALNDRPLKCPMTGDDFWIMVKESYTTTSCTISKTSSSYDNLFCSEKVREEIEAFSQVIIIIIRDYSHYSGTKEL